MKQINVLRETEAQKTEGGKRKKERRHQIFSTGLETPREKK